MKKHLATLVFAGLVGWATLGIFALGHHHISSMDGGCPGASLHVADCPENISAMAVHHFLAYQSLFNSFIFSAVVEVLALLCIVFVFHNYLASIRYLSLVRDSRHQPGKFFVRFYKSPAVSRWLSLLVNSPSFS